MFTFPINLFQLALFSMVYNYKPQDGTYPEFYKGYVDSVEDLPLIEVLEKERLHALDVFSKIRPDQIDYAYAEGKWNIKQLLLHILDTEKIFSYRCLSIARGEKQSLPGFDQTEYMSETSLNKATLEELIACFDMMRRSIILHLGWIDKERMQYVGTASNNPVSANAIGYMIAGHCRHHTNILESRYHI